MNNIQQVSEAILKQKILPLYYNTDQEISLEILKAVYRAGIRAVEYTNRGDAALQNFKAMIQIKKSEMPDLFLGVGTIKTLADAEAYYNAGADFFISPGFVPKVADYLNKKEIFYGPGCMTPSEIISAENAGLTFIKLFPGNLLGPGFVSAIKDIFPHLNFMPTGGVDTTKENIASWFNAGVSAVGMGSKLISKKLMAEKDYTAIESKTRRVLELIQTLR